MNILSKYFDNQWSFAQSKLDCAITKGTFIDKKEG